jgi:hypothetical protein
MERYYGMGTVLRRGTLVIYAEFWLRIPFEMNHFVRQNKVERYVILRWPI